jgi:hypothetical protein
MSLCYSREHVKREEIEIHQYQSMCFTIQFIIHSRMTSHVPRNHLIPHPEYYTLLIQLSSIQQCHLIVMRQYLQPHLSDTKQLCHYYKRFSHHVHIYQYILHFIICTSTGFLLSWYHAHTASATECNNWGFFLPGT